MSRAIISLIVIAIGTGLPAVGSPGDEQLDNTVAWMLGCQGCHGADGVALGNEVPALENTVARFLSIPGGREYLIRVPGVAMSPLNNADVAELTNWMLRTMDPGHIPDDFEEYSAQEVGRLRQKPLGFEAADVRARLIGQNAVIFNN